MTTQKVNEFELPPKFEVPPYTWSNSFRDWYRQAFLSDEEVEKKLLCSLPFFPESDGVRKADIINTEVQNGIKIHEFYVENTKESTETRDIVLVHGYAASLGLFIENFADLTKVPGVRLHVIDLPGFGFSSRPKFPNYPVKTKDDIYKTEDWFIDTIEDWRKKRNIKHFTLIGHSMGGYLSCAYALKFNKKYDNVNLIDKMVLISPVGVERNRFSLLKDSSEGMASESERREQNKKQNVENPDIIMDNPNVLRDHEQALLNPADHEKEVEAKIDKFLERRSARIFSSLWGRHWSPFTFIRGSGPLRSKWISNWTRFRFAYMYERDPEQFQTLHNYMYRVFNGDGSGEYALTRLLAFPAMARLPLLDRCPQKFAEMNLPTLWLYGDKDWMDEKAGKLIVQEINAAAKSKIASYGIVPDAGHHLYLDNPRDFSDQVWNFLGF